MLSNRLTGKRYGFMGRSGVGFQMLPEPEVAGVYGTRVTLTVRDGVSLGDLVRYACDGFWHSGVETHLHLPAPVVDCEGGAEFCAGTFRIGPCRPSAYMSRILCDRNMIEFPDGAGLSQQESSTVKVRVPIVVSLVIKS